MNQSYRMLNIYKMALFYTKVGNTVIPSCCLTIYKEEKVYFHTSTLHVYVFIIPHPYCYCGLYADARGGWVFFLSFVLASLVISISIYYIHLYIYISIHI